MRRGAWRGERWSTAWCRTVTTRRRASPLPGTTVCLIQRGGTTVWVSNSSGTTPGVPTPLGPPETRTRRTCGGGASSCREKGVRRTSRGRPWHPSGAPHRRWAQASQRGAAAIFRGCRRSGKAGSLRTSSSAAASQGGRAEGPLDGQASERRHRIRSAAIHAAASPALRQRASAKRCFGRKGR